VLVLFLEGCGVFGLVVVGGRESKRVREKERDRCCAWFSIGSLGSVGGWAGAITVILAGHHVCSKRFLLCLGLDFYRKSEKNYTTTTHKPQYCGE